MHVSSRSLACVVSMNNQRTTSLYTNAGLDTCYAIKVIASANSTSPAVLGWPEMGLLSLTHTHTPTPTSGDWPYQYSYVPRFFRLGTRLSDV